MHVGMGMGMGMGMGAVSMGAVKDRGKATPPSRNTGTQECSRWGSVATSQSELENGTK